MQFYKVYVINKIILLLIRFPSPIIARKFKYFRLQWYGATILLKTIQFFIRQYDFPEESL